MPQSSKSWMVQRERKIADASVLALPHGAWPSCLVLRSIHTGRVQQKDDAPRRRERECWYGDSPHHDGARTAAHLDGIHQITCTTASLSSSPESLGILLERAQVAEPFPDVSRNGRDKSRWGRAVTFLSSEKGQRWLSMGSSCGGGERRRPGERRALSPLNFFSFSYGPCVLVSLGEKAGKPVVTGPRPYGDGQKTYRQTNKPRIKVFTGGNDVNSLKGGIPKIWGETLLLLLLGIDIDIDIDID
jgi:hypothetical protein